MSMYTSVLHPDTGQEIQFKTGRDVCDTYKVGDAVDWCISKSMPERGTLLDDVYIGRCGYPDTQHWWVVIKDHYLHAVLLAEMEVPELVTQNGIFKGGMHRQRAAVYKRYGIVPQSFDSWPIEAWARAARDAAVARQHLLEQHAQEYQQLVLGQHTGCPVDGYETLRRLLSRSDPAGERDVHKH